MLPELLNDTAMPRDPNRRQTIIDGASQLFLLEGYDGVTVDKICAHTNSAKGSFYHFFESKEDLAVQLINDVWRRTEERMQETFSEEKPPLKRIRDELNYCYEGDFTVLGTAKYLTGCPIGTLSLSLGNKSDRIRRRVNFAFNHMRHYYLTTFSEAVERGDIGGDPASMADLMLVTIQGLGVMGRSTNSPAKVKQLVKAITGPLTR